jgi:carboxyl-terminal processing protease
LNNFFSENKWFLVSALLASLLVAHYLVPSTHLEGQGDESSYYDKTKVFRDVLLYVRNNYVDEDKLGAEKLIYGAIEGMLGTLDDPYSRLMRPDQYKSMKTETSQEFGGLGIYITIKNSELTVIAPIEGTPAFEAGIKPGDVISAIEGDPTKDIKKTGEAVDLLRGPKGSDVTITIRRPSKTFDVTITRDEIPIKSVFHSMIDPNRKIGYVKITNFGEKTFKELNESLGELHDKGMESLVLDLRNNPGGLLQAAFKVANKWISDGRIVYTRGRASGQDKNFPASPENTEGDYPMAVLMNGGSASGSEIVAGALKDHDRAVTLGDTSFGKGLVQSVFPLDDGAALALTTAKYYTPDGHMIHDQGVPPHIVVEQDYPDTNVRRELSRLTSGDTVLEFVRDHPNPTQEEIDQFIERLRERGDYTMGREYFLNRIHSKQLAMEGQTTVADPNTDHQLGEALDIFRRSLSREPWSVSGAIDVARSE